MTDYTELRLEFDPCTPDITDVAAALLCDGGYESFQPDASGITAWVKHALFDKDAVDTLLAPMPFHTRWTAKWHTVEGRDWNHEWEKHYFKPISVDGQCVIHSSFHKDYPHCPIDLTIDPRMAFGTGHHATTTLMIRRLLAKPPVGQRVIDMGTGTGILAMLAEKLGAKQIHGIEIDEAAYQNAVDNIALNHCSHISLIHGDATVLPSLSQAHLLLANINRNIVIADMQAYSAALLSDGVLLLSGFYEHDIPMVVAQAKLYGLSYIDHILMDQWTSLKFVKQVK